MADAAFDQFRLVLGMTAFTHGMGGILEGIDFFRQTGLAVMAGFAFFDFLPFCIGDSLTVTIFSMVAGFAFQTCLVRSMGEFRWLRSLGWVYGSL